MSRCQSHAALLLSHRGIIRVRHLGAWAVGTYSAVLGLIVAAGLGLDAAGWSGAGAWPSRGGFPSAEQRVRQPGEKSAGSLRQGKALTEESV